MYDVWPNAILGFHGCDAKVAKSLLINPQEIRISREPYDWLGHGMYFWESNYERAMSWAEEKTKRGQIKNPAVIGAVIQLGHCFNLLDSRYIKMMSSYYSVMENMYLMHGAALPENKDLSSDQFKDKILRELDCSVIQFMHDEFFKAVKKEEKEKGFSRLQLFDSARGAFTEGAPAFKGSGIPEKTHIQVCVRNFNCIKGFFLPRKEIDFRKWLDEEANNIYPPLRISA